MLSPTPPINRPGLHPGSGYLIGPRVPHGLAAVVEGLTREVLRHRPEDIYVFAAHHFEKLLKLREQYHAEKYRNIREFDGDFSREFNLWPTKDKEDVLDKEVKVFEKRGKVPTDVEESPEDVSADREKRKISKQICTKSSSSTKRVSRRSTKDKDATSETHATKIPQMSAFRGSSRTILTKDIKQELRKNKLNSGEKGKLSDSMDKGIRGERRSRAKTFKTDKSAAEEIERAAMTTTGRTSTRRPLKKVRRVETESETETEREIAAKDRLGNGYERVSVKGDSVSREATTGSRGRRQEAAWSSEHSSERKVSSRALSMDRIRAYVLRKFASTASLEVLRSPTYVEQVQEVIDRAAPIIKEKLEEIRKPQGKRSRSVDFTWNEDFFRRGVAKDSRKCDDRDEEEKSKRKNGSGVLEQESNDARREDKSEDQSARRSKIVSNAESEERRPGRRSTGSGRRRRRESGWHGDLGIADRVDDKSEHNNKPEHESDAGRDTLEARLTATQSILEGISMSASELNGSHKVDPASDERGEPTASPEVSDHVVSLPIVRPPSSRSSRSAAKNDSDSLTLPPISPEAPKSTKKKDELSLPILSAAPNGNHSVKRSQEQDDSKDVEEASTMRDITSDMEDIVVLPEDEDEYVTAVRQDPMNDHQDLISDAKSPDREEDEEDKDAEQAVWKDTPRELSEKCISDVSLDRDFEEYRKSTEERRAEEIYNDSLNVTPEVADVPPRPDSLELDEDERDKLRDEDVDDNAMRSNTFDDLKDRLIEIEMAERNIEKALAGQQTATYNDEVMTELERSTSIEEMDEARKSSEAEEVASEIRKSTSERGTPNKERKSMNEEEKEEKSTNKAEEGNTNIERSTNEKEIPSEERKSTNKEEEKEESTNKAEEGNNNIERSTNETEIPSEGRKLMNEEETEEESINEVEKSSNNIERSTDEKEMSNERRKSLNEEEEEEKSANEAEQSTTVTNKEPIEEKRSKAQGMSTNEAEKVPNGVEELMVKHHIKNLESTDTRYKMKNDQTVMSVHGTGDKDDATASNGKNSVTKNRSSRTTDSRNTGTADEHLKASLPTNGNDIGKTKARKKRETNEVPATTPLSLKIPFSYVLSEGSPCEIPDSVTTVIIPDRPCPSPVIPEIEDRQSGSTYLPIEPTAHDNIVEGVSSKDETRQDEQDRAEYGMEAFGEYICPEVTALPVDVDFVHGAKGVKPGQDIMIVHQDLDRIKEEGEEEEEDKENDKRGKDDSHLEKKDDEQIKEIVKLEDIVEHEENETNTKMIAEGIPSSRVPESEAIPENTDLTNADKTDVAGESRSTLDNSSEENGSSHDIHTTTSSEAKESTISNRSIESSSAGRPIVPELNLDSLQDNTVSSFKMTANGTATKESNDSPRESDATMSLVEPLTPDERLAMENRLVLADRELEIPVEELALSSSNFRPQSDVPEADQLYLAEHAEYELLEKDPLSSEAALEDEVRAQEEDVVGLKASSEDAARVDSTSRSKRESEELDSEEEIAKELIGLLDKEAQLRAEESGRGERFEDHSISVDEVEKGKSDVFSEQSRKLDDESVSRIEAVSELSGHIADNSQENETEDKAMANIETEDSRFEVEKKEHVESSQVTHLAESERDESSAKDNATINEETEESKEEGEKYIETSQVASLAESERNESSKDSATTNEETEEPKEEVVEKKHIETSQVASLAKSERNESSAEKNATRNEESEKSKEEVVEKKHIETSQVASLTESERNESSAKDNATANEESEEPKEEVVEKKHIETSQVAPLAEFEQDEFLEENGSHETPDEKITAEEKHNVIDADFANDQENPEDKRADIEGVLKSQSESTSKIEEFHEKQKENKHEECEDRGKSEEENVEVQGECQEKELSDEEKREQKESIVHEENQEHVEVQEAMKSREDSPKKSTESNKDSGHDQTPTKSTTPDEFIADHQTARDAIKGEEEKVDDMSAKLESVHGPITSAISEQSTQDYHQARHWTMGTKSSTAETVIAAFGSNTSAGEKTESLSGAPKNVENESISREKDDFYSAVVKIQACIRGFLARRRLRKDPRSVPNDVPSAQETAAVNKDHLLVPEECSSLREARSGRHPLRREEALRKTTLSLENAFATSRLQHTGEFHDSVPLPLFDMTHSETKSDDSDESLNKEAEEEPTKTDTAKSSKRETTDSNCHECQGSSQKSNAFANHSGLPIVMQLLADASRNCHFRINRNSDSDLNLSSDGAKLMEPALDILMLGYPRDDATLQNRYLNFITSVEDIGSNMDYLSPDVAMKSATNVNDAQPSVASGEASVPESLREPLALPGTPQGVVIEELTSLDETTGEVSSTKASTATKTSLDTNSSVPLEECALEDNKDSESSPRTNPADKGNTISDQKNTVEEVTRESRDSSVVDHNSRSVRDVGLCAEDANERSNAIFHDSNGHADEGKSGKT